MLSNKYVVYSVLIISAVSVLGYLANKDFDSLTLFLAVYLLSCYFTKKTTVRLLAALVVTVFLGKPNKRHWPWMEREGFKEGNDINKMEISNEKGNITKKVKDKASNEALTNPKLQEQMKKLEETMKGALGENGMEELMQGMDASQLEGLQQEIKPQDLEKHMKNMEPLVKNAQRLLETFEKSGIMNMLDKITPLLGKALPKQN